MYTIICLSKKYCRYKFLIKKLDVTNLSFVFIRTSTIIIAAGRNSSNNEVISFSAFQIISRHYSLTNMLIFLHIRESLCKIIPGFNYGFSENIL